MADSKQSPSSSDVTSASGGGFQRRSSGLVREFSPTDSWMYNVLAMNPVVVGAFTFGLVQITYPNASLWLSFLIAGLFCSAEAVAYALFTSAMPRSGGDYVMQSRVFGGGTASVFTFAGITLSQCFLPGIFGFILATVVLSPFLQILGAQTSTLWLMDFGDWLATDWGIFTCCMFVALQGSLVNVRGLHLYARLQRIVFWPALALLVFFIAQLLFTSHGDWVTNYNAFMLEHHGVSNAFEGTLQAGGTVDTSFSLGKTILASVIGAFLLIFPAYSVQQAGEVRRATSVRSNLWSMLGAEVFCVGTMAILGALLVSRVGSDFLYSSATLYFGGGDTSTLPVAPFLGMFFAIAGNSPVFTVLLLIMFVCWIVMLFPNGWLGGTRIISAMTFDRILPERLGRVHRKFHVPLNAIIAMTIVSIPFAVLYVFQPSLQALTLGYFIILITTFGVTMAAAILFPFVRPDLYNSSPAAKYKVLGVPAISVFAAIFLAFVIFCDIQAIRADELGVNQTKGLVFLVGLWATALVIYLVSWGYRKSRGESVGDAYRQLPVE